MGSEVNGMWRQKRRHLGDRWLNSWGLLVALGALLAIQYWPKPSLHWQLIGDAIVTPIVLYLTWPHVKRFFGS
jgi:hypothetical protein